MSDEPHLHRAIAIQDTMIKVLTAKVERYEKALREIVDIYPPHKHQWELAKEALNDPS